MWNTRVFYSFLFVWRKSCSFESESINSDYATDNIVKKLGEIMEQFKTLETRNGVFEGENKILNEKLKGCLESSEIHKNLSVGEISNQENENAKVKVNVNTFLSEMNPDDFNSRLREVENKINSVAILFNETVDKIREDQLTTEKHLLKITCDIFTATLNPFDCLELYNKGCVTGVYSIYPWSVSDRSLRVLCDMDTAGGGWTVIQKRNDGSVSFARNWTEYQKGFGHAETEYWLGNEAIHALTLNTSSLYVKLQKKNGEEFYRSYPDFSISDARDDYQLRIGPHSKMSAVSDVTECNGLTSFLCKNERCISDQKECNGVDDCGDGSD
ncbi:angiopoietin-related protein 7-like [Saccostrea cucullata]|uniref:angiopoietin-related protein 7-like n=1 Tax=Saccostrea cuccullata TaxID=36930 RepID=UPI002ED5D29E